MSLIPVCAVVFVIFVKIILKNEAQPPFHRLHCVGYEIVLLHGDCGEIEIPVCAPLLTLALFMKVVNGR